MLLHRHQEVGVTIPMCLASRLTFHAVLINQNSTLSAGSVFIFADEQGAKLWRKNLLFLRLPFGICQQIPPAFSQSGLRGCVETRGCIVLGSRVGMLYFFLPSILGFDLSALSGQLKGTAVFLLWLTLILDPAFYLLG